MDEPQAPAPRTHRARRTRSQARGARGPHRRVDALHHAQDRRLRGAGRGGARDDRAQCGHHPRGNRHRVPRRPRGDRGLAGGRRRDRRRARALSARHVPRHRPGERAARFRAARAQSGAQRSDRRQAHGVRAGVRLAVRAQPRRGPPLRDDRGLPQLRQACVPCAVAASLRRHDLRARRPAGEQAAFRHGVQPHEVQRQAVHGLGHAPGARAGFRRDGEDPVRRSVPRSRDRQAEDGDHQPHQREFADDLRRHDARRREGLCAQQPGDDHHAVHPRGRDVAGHGGRHGRADACRGALRHGVRPARRAGRAGGVGQLRVVDLDAVRRADVRHARARARAVRDGGAGAAPWRSVPLRRRAVRLEDPGRAGGLRVRQHAAADVPRRREFRAAHRRLAGGRTCRWATRNS